MKTLFTFPGRHGQTLFLLSLIFIYYLLDFQLKIFTPPHGMHFIRQTDCLSFVSNYYNNGFDFFSPQLFTLYNEDGGAACEFPVLYYITALISLVVYKPVLILKLLTLIIVSAGFLYLFKLLRQLLYSFFYAWVFSLLFISSTILLHYSVNVLPDPAALGFTLIAWYHVFNFREKRFAYAWGFGMFTLASLLKVTFFLYPAAAVLYLCFVNRGTSASAARRKAGLWFFVSFALVLLWNLYVLHYNAAHHASSFLLHAVPLWHMRAGEIHAVTDHVLNFWYSEYYYQTSQHLFFVITLLGFVFVRWAEKSLLILFGLLILGCASFVVLFFPQFKDHDYYFITLLPAFALLFAISFSTLQKRISSVLSSLPVKGIFLLICILSLNYAHKKLKEREQKPADKYSSIVNQLINAERILDSLHVPKHAKIIVYPDYTPNGGLYLANRQGWGVKTMDELRAVEPQASYILLTDSKIKNEFVGFKEITDELQAWGNDDRKKVSFPILLRVAKVD
ncbi:MAG: hypothetical protein K0R65_1147 [Crocinitomicaceae bacterium]|jgi:4-amino-4-deoxy-L-arabinose transferase-like glycosyltransferase|nr:hypothetical protein [Crocinitomicaceae bacterium]